MSQLTTEKVDQAIGLLGELDIDLWLTFVRETADGSDPALPLIFDHSLTWPSALLLTKSGERIAIVGTHDAALVESTGAWTDVIGYIEGVGEPMREVIDRFNPGRIAINYSTDDVKTDGLTHGLYLLLEDYLTPYRDRFVPASGLIGALRGRKSEEELARMRRAITLAESIFAEIPEYAQIGRTEREIATFMRRRAAEHSAGPAWDPAGCPIVCTGPESMPGHAVPSDTLAVKPGGILQIDFGVRLDGYCSDMQRVWYVPEPGESAPPKEVQHAFDTVRLAIECALERLKPGVLGWQIDEIARQTIIDGGFPPYDHALGHQVGRAAHDGGALLGPKWPRYGRTPEMPIEPGQVFTVEPTLMDAGGRGSLGLEEMVLITDTGWEYLSTPQQSLPLLHSSETVQP